MSPRRQRQGLLSGNAEKQPRNTSDAVTMTLPVHADDAPAGRGGNGNLRVPAGPGRSASSARRRFLLDRRKNHMHFHLRKEGDSGRSGINPLLFLRICFRSSSKVSAAVNVLWPVVPAAVVCRYVLEDSATNHLIIFILAYIAMVPCANMIGYAGQELAHKMPHVMGILTETTIGSIVEIVLFNVLLVRGLYTVIQAAILGSLLATMLLCLGMCFFVGGLVRDEQVFSETVSEAGTGLLLTAGFGLSVPTLFSNALSSTLDAETLERKVLNISRVTAILLIISYAVFIFFQTRTHHGIYDDIFEGDENWVREHEIHTGQGHEQEDHAQSHLTMTECIIALSISVALVTLIALALVEQIEYIVEERGVSDSFMGLILVPFVEKLAEHLTAIDEAHENQMNFALSHILGATLQTALFNGPLVVIVGWGLHRDMGLNFSLFDMSMLMLAIITVGNFLRDQKSNYLEGVLCVIVYVNIAVAAFNYPNPETHAE